MYYSCTVRYLLCFLFILLLNNSCLPPQSSRINPCVCMCVWFPFHKLCKTSLPAVSNQRSKWLKIPRLEGEAVQFSVLSLSIFVYCALPHFCSDSYNIYYSPTFLKFDNSLNVRGKVFWGERESHFSLHPSVLFWSLHGTLKYTYI